MTLLTATTLFMAGVVILIGGLMVLMPRLGRPELWFAVTVTSGFRDSEEGRRLLRGFRVGVVASSVGALLVLILGLRLQNLGFVTASGLIQVAGYTAAFLVAHRGTIPHATPGSTVREADLRPRRSRLPGGFLLQAGPFLILAAAAVWIGTQWDRLPARFPSHWDLAGAPDAWATRSVAGVFGPSAVGSVVCASILLLGIGLLARTRRVSVSGSAGMAEERFRFLTLAVLLGVEYLIAFTFAVHTALPLARSPAALLAGITALTFVFIVATFVVLARAGQGGSRLAAAQGGETPIGDRTADVYWRWGLCYVNRGDPALLVEKRFGLGYTLNFGNRWAWVILVAIVLVPIAVAFLMELAS